MLYGIIAALVIVAVLLFVCFWVPSRRAGLDQMTARDGSRQRTILSGLVFLGIITPLLARHFTMDSRVVLLLSGFAVVCGAVAVFTPGARRMMGAIKRVASRK
ncbi:MAG: hypothetical protein M3150_03960 [Pseudomonadota bacterium]|nr:hypothetical protein [Pseudomonadota bacterium]